MARVGSISKTIFIVSKEAGQTPLTVVQTKEFVPVDKPETKELFNVGVEIEDPPEITLHIPFPVPGINALRFVVVVVKQNV